VGPGKPGWLEITLYTQLLVYADDVNILGRSIRTIEKNTKSFVIGSMEIGPEVNADDT
jgi:hypothetical protein